MTIRKFAVIACLLASTAATAQVAASASAAPAPVKEKMVCRSAVATGSIMTKRECHTKSEWVAMQAKDAKDTDRYVSDKNSGSLPPQVF